MKGKFILELWISYYVLRSSRKLETSFQLGKYYLTAAIIAS